jgi:hypothetical protein
MEPYEILPNCILPSPGPCISVGLIYIRAQMRDIYIYMYTCNTSTNACETLHVWNKNLMTNYGFVNSNIIDL